MIWGGVFARDDQLAYKRVGQIVYGEELLKTNENLKSGQNAYGGTAMAPYIIADAASDFHKRSGQIVYSVDDNSKPFRVKKRWCLPRTYV